MSLPLHSINWVCLRFKDEGSFTSSLSWGESRVPITCGPESMCEACYHGKYNLSCYLNTFNTVVRKASMGPTKVTVLAAQNKEWARLYMAACGDSAGKICWWLGAEGWQQTWGATRKCELSCRRYCWGLVKDGVWSVKEKWCHVTRRFLDLKLLNECCCYFLRLGS